MAGLKVRFLGKATTSDEGGVTLGWGSPSLEILVPSSCFSSATLQVSCGASLSGLAFSVAISNPIRDISCQTGQVGPESRSCILAVKVCQHSRVGLTLPIFRLNW